MQELARGADIGNAAWKQSATAEPADAIAGADYGPLLLDLVKAFEKMPHHTLAREAMQLKDCLWLLRLALASCRLGSLDA